MLINSGIAIPDQVLQIYGTINQIQQTLNFLNVQFRIEGMMVTTDSYSSYSMANADNTWLPNMIAKIPEYTKADLFDYQTGC